MVKKKPEVDARAFLLSPHADTISRARPFIYDINRGFLRALYIGQRKEITHALRSQLVESRSGRQLRLVKKHRTLLESVRKNKGGMIETPKTARFQKRSKKYAEKVSNSAGLTHIPLRNRNAEK